jgi:hypothetical protein
MHDKFSASEFFLLSKSIIWQKMASDKIRFGYYSEGDIMIDGIL